MGDHACALGNGILAFSKDAQDVCYKARNLFYVYGAIMGLSLASILMVYTGASVARAFFITAGAFAGLSLYGYTTKRSLSAMGSFLIIGLLA